MSDAAAPLLACPACGVETPDFDGFGVLFCDRCGYCRHPAITGDRCDLCGRPVNFDAHVLARHRVKPPK